MARKIRKEMKMFKNKYIKLLLIIMLVFLPSCAKELGNSDSSDVWLIPEGAIQDGGPGKDGIAAISLNRKRWIKHSRRASMLCVSGSRN